VSEEFLTLASHIVSRNLTTNISAVTAGLEDGHLSVTYFCKDEPTIGDEEERELSVGELIAALPEVRIADADSKIIGSNFTVPADEQIVFQRD
jgi:hypothetical protein